MSFVKYNPCLYTVLITPLICYPIIYFTKCNGLFITIIPLTTTSILYHHKFNINNIRKYDIILSYTAGVHHGIYCYLYNINMYNFFFAYGITLFFYVTGIIFFRFNYVSISRISHGMVHLSLINSMMVITQLR